MLAELPTSLDSSTFKGKERKIKESGKLWRSQDLCQYLSSLTPFITHTSCSSLSSFCLICWLQWYRPWHIVLSYSMCPSGWRKGEMGWTCNTHYSDGKFTQIWNLWLLKCLILRLWLPGMQPLVIADLSEDLAAYACRIEESLAWKCKQNVPLKWWYISNKVYHATSQGTAVWMHSDYVIRKHIAWGCG